MKDIFSLVTFTGAATSFAILLTSFPSVDMPELGWTPAVTATVSAHANRCRLQRPLLADSRDGLSVLAHLREA
jgi:hypothetical protein